MKKYLLFMALLALVTGCDAPQRTRGPGNWVNGNSLNDFTGGTNFTNPGGIGQLTTSGNGSGITSGTTTGSTSGFEGCDLTAKFQTGDIGWFGLCQSTTDESSFRFRPSLTSSQVKICLIPTYRDSAGNSTYLGQPQCTYTISNQVIQGKLYKNREGFTTYPINGVMVMRESLLVEYFGCMNGFANFPRNACAAGPTFATYCNTWGPRCPYGPRSSTMCDAEAKNYMNQVCTNFKNRYSNAFLDVAR
jgi:hypothetical protein